jgi:histidinol-phosphatase (PHP family)
MEKFNYHSHTDYCDGKDKAEDMILSAIKKGIKYYGISSHGPVPFETDWTMKKEMLEDYLKEMKMLKKKYKEKINIFIGLEIDYIPGWGISHINNSVLKELDYTIGSVHYLGKFRDGTMWTVDYNREELEEGIKETYDGQIRNAVQEYYGYVAEMCEVFKPDILGHLDLIKKSNKNNYFFNEKDEWYREIVFKCLKRIKNAGTIMEINTGGKFRGYTDEYYPSDWIVKKALEMEIPITLSADSHSVDSVDFEFDEAYKYIKKIGYKKLSILKNKGWEEIEI